MLNFAKISFVICKLFAIISFAIGSENDPEFRKKNTNTRKFAKKCEIFRRKNFRLDLDCLALFLDCIIYPTGRNELIRYYTLGWVHNSVYKSLTIFNNINKFLLHFLIIFFLCRNICCYIVTYIGLHTVKIELKNILKSINIICIQFF